MSTVWSVAQDHLTHPLKTEAVGGRRTDRTILGAVSYTTRYFLGGKSTDHPLGSNNIVYKPNAFNEIFQFSDNNVFFGQFYHFYVKMK